MSGRTVKGILAIIILLVLLIAPRLVGDFLNMWSKGAMNAASNITIEIPIPQMTQQTP